MRNKKVIDPIVYWYNVAMVLRLNKGIRVSTETLLVYFIEASTSDEALDSALKEPQSIELITKGYSLIMKVISRTNLVLPNN